jgi:hypothetical protein
VILLSVTSISRPDIHSARREPRRGAEFAVFLLLALVTSALFAPERGLWWDDALHLAIVHRAAGTPWGLFTPIASPTRRLVGLPYALALATPWPALVLQAIYVAVWLGIGLLTRRLAARIFPGERLLAFLAGALALTSTGDLITNSTMGLHYVVTTLCYLAALDCALAALVSPRWLAWLALSAAVLQGSLWNADVAVPTIALTPLLFALVTSREHWRRAVTVTVTWGAACLPFAWAFARVLANPATYVASHLPALSLLERIHLAIRLVRWDFTPWRWVFDRPAFYAAPAWVIPTVLLAGLAALSAFTCGLLALRLLAAKAPATGGLRRDAALGLAFLSLGGVTAVTLAGVHYSEVYLRTQQMSRVWASLLLALLTVRLARLLRPAPVALVVPATFLFFGVWSGLERQAYLAGAWRANARELRSIVVAVPQLAPGATLFLVHPPTSGLLATEAGYLAESWFDLLYDRRDASQALVTWADHRHAGCLATATGFECWKENETPCTAGGPCPHSVRPYDRLVILVFDPPSGVYRLAEQIPPALLGRHPDLGRAYQPHRWIVPGEPTPLARKLLAERTLFSR